MLVLHSWAVLRMQAVFRGQRARREAGVGSHNPTYIESEDRRQAPHAWTEVHFN